MPPPLGPQRRRAPPRILELASADSSTQPPVAAWLQRSKSSQEFQGDVIHVDEEEWTECVDEASGKPYYHNAASNSTRWEAACGLSSCCEALNISHGVLGNLLG
jgi:hypothetical protein